MEWRVAKALIVLRDQVNKLAPRRSKINDGTIGDSAHASRSSDHNPWVDGSVVTAIDFTHDPVGGFDSYAFAEDMRKAADDRVKYIISNGRICSSQVDPWRWRPYNGTNKHDHHVHVSVLPYASKYDDTHPWPDTPTAFVKMAVTQKKSTLPDETVLALGTKGPEVEELQRLLGVEPDGHFGPNTDEAVRHFQQISGLHADGVVGTYTWLMLRKGKKK